MEQYRLMLSGRTFELRYQVSLLAKAAAQNHKSLNAYIDKFVQSSDSDFASQGELMHQMTQRLDHLNQALESLSQSSPLARPLAFVSHLDWQIGRETLAQFHPGLSFTLETGLYALFGFFFGWLIYRLMRALASPLKKKVTP